jgi:nucleotide-binding universal stress UspA family protein
MEQRIILAHDGSINADWVCRYALRMAAALPGQRLQLVHILDGSVDRARIEARFASIVRECRQEGLHCEPLVRGLHGSVVRSLLEVLPPGREHLCLCGARVASRGRGFLAGTVSERLLRSGHCNVLAVRVVSPGLLGCPRTLLFPLAGHPRGFQSALPFLHLFAASVQRLHLLRVMVVHPLRQRSLSPADSRERVRLGYAYLTRVADEIRSQADAPPCHLERHAVLAADWAGEILVQAGKLGVQMILLGASERSLPHRVIYGNPLERILRDTACDVGIYRRP